MAALRQPPAAWTAVVEAPRRTSSDARPRRPECDETPSRPSAAARTWTRRLTWCGLSGMTRSAAAGDGAVRNWSTTRATAPTRSSRRPPAICRAAAGLVDSGRFRGEAAAAVESVFGGKAHEYGAGAVYGTPPYRTPAGDLPGAGVPGAEPGWPAPTVGRIRTESGLCGLRGGREEALNLVNARYGGPNPASRRTHTPAEPLGTPHPDGVPRRDDGPSRAGPTPMNYLRPPRPGRPPRRSSGRGTPPRSPCTTVARRCRGTWIVGRRTRRRSARTGIPKPADSFRGCCSMDRCRSALRRAW